MVEEDQRIRTRPSDQQNKFVVPMQAGDGIEPR